MSGVINTQISPALFSLPIADPTTGLPSATYAQAWQSLVNGGALATWTPGISTGVSYTYNTQWGVALFYGQLSVAFFALQVDSVGGTPPAGPVTISGLTTATAPDGPYPSWLSVWGGITLSAGYTALGLSVETGNNYIEVMQSGSGQATLALPSSAIVAGSKLVGAIFFPGQIFSA